MKLFRVVIPTEKRFKLVGTFFAKSEDDLWEGLDKYLYDLFPFSPGEEAKPDNEWTVEEIK